MYFHGRFTSEELLVINIFHNPKNRGITFLADQSVLPLQNERKLQYHVTR